MLRDPAGPGKPGGRAESIASLSPVRRLAPLRRLRRDGFAPGVVEILLEAAEILSEGAVREHEEEATYFGTTMITIDLARAARRLRIEPSRDGSDLAALVARSAELRVRALRLARVEAERRAGDRLPGTMRAEVEARASGLEILVDVEVELPVDRGAGRRRLEGEQTP